MISLSLKQTALAVGAEPKWVLSAFARLGRQRTARAYSDDDARWLRLARVFHRELGIPLPSAAALATDALLKSRRPSHVSSPQAPRLPVAPRSPVKSEARAESKRSVESQVCVQSRAREDSGARGQSGTENSGAEASEARRESAQVESARLDAPRRRSPWGNDPTGKQRAPAMSPKADARSGAVSGTRTRNKTVLRGSRADGVGLVVDLDRFESTFQAALASALAFGAPRRAGRKPRAPEHLGAALAQAWRKRINLLHVRARMRHPLETRLGGRLPHELIAAGGNPQGAAGQIRHLLHEIRRSGVRGVLVGELAEVVRGAGLVTTNPGVELCYEPTPENRRRVARLLYWIGARVGAAAPGFADAVTLTGVEVVLLETRLGRLVLRATVPGAQDYAEVERRANGVDLFGINLAVLDLKSLRRAREAAGTKRDVERLPLLDTMIAVPFVEARQREAAARG